MAWSDYINIKSAKLTKAQTGIEALIMAVNERTAPFGGTPLELPKLKRIDTPYYIGLNNATLMEHIDNSINGMLYYYLKAPFVTDLTTIEFNDDNRDGLYEVPWNNCWQSIAEICEYMGEEEIKWFAPLNKKFPAAWIEQRMRIINLLTVAKYDTDPGWLIPFYPCYVAFDCEYRNGHWFNETYDEYTHDELLSGAISDANGENGLFTANLVGITSYCYKGYTMYGGGASSRRKVAEARSGKSRFYNANSVISKSYDIVIIAKPEVNLVSSPDSPPVYDTNNSNWIEDQAFVLTRYKAENGIAGKTDWFGVTDYFPLPVPTPGYTAELNYYNTNLRGYRLKCCAVIDFAVSGGFEFQTGT